MKNIIMTVLEKIFRYILFTANILYLGERKLILFYCASSSDNGVALYTFMQNTPLSESLYWMFADDNENRQSFRKALHLLKVLPRSKIVVSTHGFPHPLSSKQFLIELWHGVPYKTLGLWQSMNPVEEKKILRTMKRVNVYCSTSLLTSQIISSCFHLLPKQLVVTGQPRNDLLIENKQALFRVIGEKMEDYDHVVFFLPTYREGITKKSEIFNPLNLSEEQFAEFSILLRKKRILWISKLHVMEERRMVERKNADSENNKNAVILLGEQIKKSGVPFYTLLASSDLLVTDYSSVFFDYLIVDKPVVFFQPDASEYWSSRGQPSFSPEKDWLPGPIANDADALIDEVIKNLHNKSLWAEKRHFLNNVINQYKDRETCLRVFKIIEKFYDNV